MEQMIQKRTKVDFSFKNWQISLQQII